MKHLILFLVFLFCIVLPAQNLNNLEYKGIKIFKYEKQKGFYYDMDSDFYLKENVGYFDYVAIKTVGILIFLNRHPSAMKYLDIYRDMIKLLGKKEDKDDSYIPSYAEGDIEYIASLIWLGKARLIKIWYVSKYIVVLRYDENGLTLGTADITKYKEIEKSLR